MFAKVPFSSCPAELRLTKKKIRIAEILIFIALSILTGFIILILQRAIARTGKNFIFKYFLLGALIILSIVFLRYTDVCNGRKDLLLWTLLGFITYLLYTSNGLHNFALLGIPICSLCLQELHSSNILLCLHNFNNLVRGEYRFSRNAWLAHKPRRHPDDYLRHYRYRRYSFRDGCGGAYSCRQSSTKY